MKELLAIISLIGFVVVSILVLLAAKFGTEWAKSMMDTILPMVIQCWIINFTTMMNYHYGTSAGSERKTDIIARQTEEVIQMTKIK
jgi:triacylglycerol esterase/lipase EstA (alpha/beta hydrolase family)